MIKRILIIGATHPVAEATARLYSERGAQLFLVAPQGARIEAIAADLRVRGAGGVHTAAIDPANDERHRAIVAESDAALGGIDLAMIAPPDSSDPGPSESSAARIHAAFDRDCASTLSLLQQLVERLEPRRGGALAVLSSVAGERGRRADPVQGAAMAALTVFLQGLRSRLNTAGVQVLTVKLGLPPDALPRALRCLPLAVNPQRAARDIVRAVDRRREVIYTPPLWAPVTWMLRALPEPLLKRLPF